jgi:hypothetical protein
MENIGKTALGKQSAGYYRKSHFLVELFGGLSTSTYGIVHSEQFA